MRYRHTADWAEQWADEGQYLARRGRGAQEAWWKASLEAEQDSAEHVEFTAPFFDLAKRYGVAPRQLAYAVLEWFGVPVKVITAWRSYLAGVRFYSPIGQTA